MTLEHLRVEQASQIVDDGLRAHLSGNLTIVVLGEDWPLRHNNECGRILHRSRVVITNEANAFRAEALGGHLELKRFFLYSGVVHAHLKALSHHLIDDRRGLAAACIARISLVAEAKDGDGPRRHEVGQSTLLCLVHVQH